MKKNYKVLTGALLMALMCVGAAAAPKTADTHELDVRDVLAEDVRKDVTGRVLRKVEGTAPEANHVVSTVKAQVSGETEGKRSIRFVAAIDSYAYESAKFNVVVKDGATEVKKWEHEVVNAYTHIMINGAAVTAADAFGGADYNYMIAFTVNNIPESAWGYTFEATASIKTAEATDYTTSPVATKVMEEMVFADALGTSFTSITNENVDAKNLAWETSVVDGAVRLDSTNEGVGSSYSRIKFEMEDRSVVSFDYAISSEIRYDFLIVNVYDSMDGTATEKLKVSGDSTDEAVTGAFIEKLEAGNVLEILYKKDSSGNRGLDHVTITNLSFTDGVPAVTVTKVVNDGATADVVATGNLMGALGEELLASPENVRGENFTFDAWYYDEARTQVANAEDVHRKVNLVLYANWLEKVDVNFVVPEGATTVAAVKTWTRTPIEVADPSLRNNIFRGWYLDAEFTQPVNLAVDGVERGCTVYAKFEELPVGATKDVAQVIEMKDTTSWSGAGETTKEFQDYYFEFTPTVTTNYFIIFDNYSIVGKNDAQYNYSSYARMWIEDAEGNVLSEEFDAASSDLQFALEADKTYYFVFNGSKYSEEAESWGTFKLDVMYFAHNTEATAIDYAIGSEVTLVPGTFISKYEERVYTFTATEDATYALKLDSDAWADVYVYADSLDGTSVVNTRVNESTSIVDLNVTEGKTYYLVLGQNWNASELASKTVSLSIKPYAQGYSPNNPSVYNVGEELTTDFSGGRNQFFAFTLAEDTVLKLNSNGTDGTNTRYIEIYAAGDMKTKLLTVSGVSQLKETFVNLPAGDYVMKTYYYNTYGVASYSVVLEEAVAGETLLKPAETELPADGNVIADITAPGYYEVSVGSEDVFHFFTANDTSATIKLMTLDGTVVATSKNGEIYKKLDANTAYIIYVDKAVEVTYSTATSVVDGTSADSAYTYGTHSNVLDNHWDTNNKNREVWFKFECSETGTYNIYTLNNGYIDTKAWVYDSANEQIGYNDDGTSAQKTIIAELGGYRYDTYQTIELTAGETYYIKVTYTISSEANHSSENGKVLTLYVNKA